MKTSLMFLLGIGMGTVLGLIVAPEPGKVTRRKIREEADKLLDKMITKAHLKNQMESPESTVIVVEERYTV
jgi:gas vesicle protein